MDMRDSPIVILPTQHHCRAKPQALSVAADFDAGHVAQRPCKREVAVNFDSYVACFDVDRPVPCREPLLQTCLVAHHGG